MKWITASHLEQWAEGIPARGLLPQLIADLILASASNIQSIRFPSGDKGQIRGFDGVLEAVGVPPYVPDGRSVWELGVDKRIQVKANEEYDKRTLQVDAANRALTTFIFVTPRTWEGRDAWLTEKRNTSDWKEVECIDAITLEAWLAENPAVAAYYARKILSIFPETGAQSIEEFWEEFSSRFDPPLAEDVLLAGRQSQAETFISQLMNGGQKFKYVADSPDEVIAFAIAAIRTASPPVRFYLESRTLVVDTDVAARQLVTRQGLIFLPRKEALQNLAGRLAQCGPTIVSAGVENHSGGYERLSRPSSSALGKAFESMGFTAQKGYEIARKCGRSLAVLARQRASGTAETPEWRQHGLALLPALLAGAWDVSLTSDKEILKSIGGLENYDQVESPMRPLIRFQESPLEHIGDVWAMRAPVDAFVNLAHLLGNEHLTRFAAAVTSVFSKITPLPKPDEVFRIPSLRDDAHSSWLREGMMITLLHMAVLHEESRFNVPGTTPQNYVNEIIRNLPGLASDHRLLASLNDNLPLLAEAAPIPFLEALERLLEGDAAAIKPLFDEHEGFIDSHTFHTGVLWALETLAWDPNFLLRATTCLARLAEIDPGGKLTNRPINSLREIFLTWSPGTHAHAKQRLGVLTHVVNRVPAIAWPLLVKLLPSSHDISNLTAKPKFRESEQEAAEVLTYSVVWGSQASIIELALQSAALISDRWKVLVHRLSQFQSESFYKTVTALDKFLEGNSENSRLDVWDTLRKEVNRHKAYTNADWTLKGDMLLCLEKLVLKYQPDDPLLKTKWLFDDWIPDVPENTDASGNLVNSTEQLRNDALREIYGKGGIAAIIDFANKVKIPHLLVDPLRSLALPKDKTIEFLLEAMDAGERMESMVTFLVADGFVRFGDSWTSEIQIISENRNLTPSSLACLLLGTPENRESWNLVASFGSSVAKEYWKIKRPFFISGTNEDLLFAVDNYLHHGRALDAIQVVHRNLNEVKSQLILRLLDAAIAQINALGDGNHTMVIYYIEKVFEELEKRTDIDLQEIAKREFAYLPFFSHSKKTLTLHRLMVESPSTYMSAICAVFEPEDAEVRDVSKEEKRLASAAFELLRNLHVLPGQDEKNVEPLILSKWCHDVRKIAEDSDRKIITDIYIGHLLAHSPVSPVDNIWPHESVRSVIEELASSDVEGGVVTERFNMRGVFGRAIGEGGQQERVLAQQAKDWADAVPSFPRTAGMLMQIYDDWVRHAADADIRAEKDALKW